MKHCFDDVDKALTDANASTPQDYLERTISKLLTIPIAIQGNVSGDLMQTVEDLLSSSEMGVDKPHGG